MIVYIIVFAIIAIYAYKVYLVYTLWCVNSHRKFVFPKLLGKIESNIVRSDNSELPTITVIGGNITVEFEGIKPSTIPVINYLPIMWGACEFYYPKWVAEVEAACLENNSVFVIRQKAREYSDKIDPKYRLAYLNKLKKLGIEDWVCTYAGILGHIGNFLGNESEQYFDDTWKSLSL